MFSIKLHHGGRFTASLKRMYVGGKVNYEDNIDVDLFNVDELHMFVQYFGYDPKQLMFYHFKLSKQSLDYGLRPLYCDDDVPSVKIEELDDDVELNASVVGSSKRLALEWLNEDDVGKSSVDKNANRNLDLKVNEELIVNVNEEQIVNVNDYRIDDSYEFNVDENLNLDDYTVYVDERMNVDVNVNENVTPPKMRVAAEYCPEALLHNTTALDT
nr:transposase, MuDR [Tanacetum cinerariifolium]